MWKPFLRTGAVVSVLVVALQLGSAPAQANVTPRAGAAPQAGMSRIQQYGEWIDVYEAFTTRANAARAVTELRMILNLEGGENWLAQIETLTTNVVINGVLAQVWHLRWRRLV